MVYSPDAGREPVPGRNGYDTWFRIWSCPKPQIRLTWSHPSNGKRVQCGSCSEGPPGSIGCMESQSSKGRRQVSTRTQILIYLALLAVIDAVIPIPITAMVLIMVLFQKPSWFKDWVDQIYRR
jgi:hypothetical protein